MPAQKMHRLITSDAVPMDSRRITDFQPDNALFFELDLKLKGQSIELSYINGMRWNGLRDHQHFLDKMKERINIGGGLDGPKPVRTRDQGAGNGNSRTKDTRLSIEWPNKELSYIVFKLNKNLDWQFSSDFYPFMMHKDDQNQSRFFDAMRFDPAGNPINGTDSAMGCQFACFVVCGPNLDFDAQGHCQHRFNINVEILERDQPGNIDNFIPIIIDPDVRNPGGSGGN